jgi:hypothetical protein
MAIVYDLERKMKPTREGVVITRKLRTDTYAYGLTIADQLLGSVKVIGGELVRTPPHQDPLLPWCFCVDVDMDGIGPYTSTVTPAADVMLDTVPTYGGGAFLTATYKTLDHDPTAAQGPGQTDQQEIELAAETWDYGGQHLTLRDSALVWKSSYSLFPANNQLISNENAQPVKVLTRLTYSITRNFVLNPPHLAIKQLTGKVNATFFGKADHQFAEETILFDGAQIDDRTTNNGFPYSKVTYKFAVNTEYDKYLNDSNNDVLLGQVGWNRIFRESAGYWERVVYPSGEGAGTRGIYELDSVVTQSLGGSAVSGFRLLFHPKAT